MPEPKKKNRPSFNTEVGAAIVSHYKDTHTKRPLAYALMSPNPLVEIAYAAGIQPAFPENYACICAARHVSGKYCETGETRGYSPDICSYCRNVFGHIYDPGENPLMGGLAVPDLLLLSSSACSNYFKWWDALHEVYHKPMIFINSPRVMEPQTEPDYYLGFTIREIEQAIADIEKTTGTGITKERLSETVRLSGELVELWQAVLELQKTVPCPVNLPDLTNALFILIALSGTQQGVDLMKKVYDETKQRVDQGIGSLPAGTENHRLLWLNIPLWYNLGLFGYFEDRGCVFPISDYTCYIWGNTRMDPTHPLESLARKALDGELNTSVDDQIERLLRDIKAYHIDGIVAHSNKSCRVLSAGLPDTLKLVKKELGIPSLLFESDHTDERVYNSADLHHRIDVFIEMLDHQTSG